MNPTLIGIIGILAMLFIFMSRMPVAYVMTMIGYLGFSIMISEKGGLNLLSRNIYDVFASYGLTTIPLFILMGQLAFNSGISHRLYDTGYKYLGSTRGGLAMATVSACTAFGAVCGSSPATAATMATVGLPEMKRYKYADELATGSVASGGGLGMIMPPSVVLIIYGVLTEQSIGALFVAGIIPAILVTTLFIISIYIWCRYSPEQGPRGESFSWKEKIKSLLGMGETVAIFVLVMGGLFAGFFTPTEAGAIGAGGAVVIGLVRRKLSWKGFVQSVTESTRISCMVLVIVAGATVFGHFMAITRIPYMAASWVGDLPLPNYAIMAFIVIIYLIGGCFMDSLAMVLLTVPILYPLVTSLGFDPIWFGVIIVLVTEMGVITPPVGINVYVVSGIAKDIPLEVIFKGALPFLLAILTTVALLMAFPQIALFLPGLMR